VEEISIQFSENLNDKNALKNIIDEKKELY
jgi:hypothetical protein